MLPIMYGKSEWKIEGMNSKMNYLHECCILLMEKSENLNSHTSVGISSGLDAVKSQNFSIFYKTFPSLMEQQLILQLEILWIL